MKYSIHQDEEELHFTDSWHSKTIVQDSHLAFFIWRNLINECAKKCKPKATPSGLLSFSVEESRKKLQTGSLTIKGTDSRVSDSTYEYGSYSYCFGWSCIFKNV